MEQLSTAVQPVNTWHSARSRRTAATSRAACAGHPWGVQGPSSAVLNFTYVVCVYPRRSGVLGVEMKTLPVNL